MEIFNNKDKEAIIVNASFNRLMEKIDDDTLNIEMCRKIFDVGFSACISLAVYKQKIKEENNNVTI